MNSEASEILLEITHCPKVRECLENPDHAHSCRQIVLSQQAKSLKEHQVPEPWSGNLPKAPLLFLSSNPSISETELYPRWSWRPEDICDYFSERFSRWIRDGLYTLQQDRTYSNSVPFWREVRSRAAELYERKNVAPGQDYALTEVVHCKSRENEGVASALNECADRYLSRVLACSAAKIIVTLGKYPEQIMEKKYGIASGSPVHGPIGLAGRDRFVVFLPAPGSNKRRTFATVVSTEELSRLRAALKIAA